jgi:hypothetical protein
MPRRYRALLSVPITAANDEEAVRIGAEYAEALLHPGGAGIAGHLELVGEVRGDVMAIARVVDADPLFLRQLPPDWKP